MRGANGVASGSTVNPHIVWSIHSRRCSWRRRKACATNASPPAGRLRPVARASLVLVSDRRYGAAMPAVPPYLMPWQPHPLDRAHFMSAVAVSRFAVSSRDLTDNHRKRLLNDAIWYRTEAASKIRIRYRSGGVLALGLVAPSEWRKAVRHEHVQTRASLIARILAEPCQVEAILAEATSCLVTIAEHHSLTQHDKNAAGWDRYRLAGVDVYDFSCDPPMPFISHEHEVDR